MAYWVKIIYERDTYVIDLKQITAFCRAPANGKLTFWLPDNGYPIVIHPQSNPEAYQKVREYLKTAQRERRESYWVRIVYERDEYDIDLSRVHTFSRTPGNGKLTFWLPDNGKPIIIHPQSNPEDYRKIVDYIEKRTGYHLS
ncbi:hypothetical protein JJD41_13075 [Oxynema sp. CENA135]|uniref:hypothetical protein n=1 Tax=Oxynema sp. CENA135 TaxID=984206 RepID=UPI00190A3DE9|nr:hypothetical protein [Oxynema sp. CENA135]MBK4730789.1 hypothetical protein [Oxynema sp. CENA135]